MATKSEFTYQLAKAIHYVDQRCIQVVQRDSTEVEYEVQPTEGSKRSLKLGRFAAEPEDKTNSLVEGAALEKGWVPQTKESLTQRGEHVSCMSRLFVRVLMRL